MKAAVMTKPGIMELQDVPMPTLKRDEALVQVKAVGICGSDLHYFEHGRIGRYHISGPFVLGHELSGEVVAVGDAVTRVEIGSRVAVEPGITCGRCDYCKAGRYNLCPDVAFMATPPVGGAWAEYVAVREDFLFALPDEMSFETGALLEPLSVGIHALRRAQMIPAQSVLVTGLGPVGALAVAAARMFGASRISGIDPFPVRRQMAQALGADSVFHPADDAAALEEQHQSYDIVVECSGHPASVLSTTKYARRGGKWVQVGLPVDGMASVNIGEIADHELDVLGVFRYVNTYPLAIQLLSGHSAQRVDIEQVITHRFSLDQIKEALDVSLHEKDSCVKVMIYPS